MRTVDVAACVGGDRLDSATEDVAVNDGVGHVPLPHGGRAFVGGEFNPQVVIKAKLTGDDGTARDKVTRVQHLAALSERGMPEGARDLDFVPGIAPSRAR